MSEPWRLGSIRRYASGLEDYVSAPISHAMPFNADQVLNEKDMSVEEFFHLYPFLIRVEGNPLLEDFPNEWLLSEAGQIFLLSVFRICYLNNNLCDNVAASLLEENLRVSALFKQARLLTPTGVKFDLRESNAHRWKVFRSAAELVDKLLDKYYPGIPCPKDLSQLVDTMKMDWESPYEEELVVHNPCLQSASGFWCYMCHTDLLLRKVYHAVGSEWEHEGCYWSGFDELPLSSMPNPLRDAIACMVLYEIGETMGYDGEEGKANWEKMASKDILFNDSHIHSNGFSPKYSPMEDTSWRGSKLLGTARGALVHAWDPGNVKKFNGKMYTLQDVVDHQRVKLPLLAHNTARRMFTVSSQQVLKEFSLSKFCMIDPFSPLKMDNQNRQPSDFIDYTVGASILADVSRYSTLVNRNRGS